MIRGELRPESIERFWDKVAHIPFHTCWEWTAAKNEKGYGVFGVGKETDKASRLAYKLTKGPIPRGLFVLHSCDNPGCVNPDHLWLGTNLDNVKDMIKKGRNSPPPRPKPSLRSMREKKAPGIYNPKIVLSDECIASLGQESDEKTGKRFGVSKRTINRARRERNIPSFAARTGNTGKFIKDSPRHPRWG